MFDWLLCSTLSARLLILMPWEEDTDLTFADGEKWRWLPFAAAYGAVFAVPLLKLLGGG